MFSEQKIRAFLFYLCVAVFLAGLPPILSFALGYKFNPRTLGFTKTGIVSLKTQPEGASIYLDGVLLNEKTPATINELLPESYKIELKLKHYYPWVSQISVEPGKVERLERIILFPVRQHIKQLNQGKVSCFWLDKDKSRVYFMNQEENKLYKSNLEGERLEEIGSLPQAFLSPPIDLKISPDRAKILLFNRHQICVIYPRSQGVLSSIQPPDVIDYSHVQINNVFWHSDSYHLVVVTDRNIEVTDTETMPNPVNLVSLSKSSPKVFYDTEADALYFIDTEKGVDGVFYENVYRLELNAKSFVLNDLIKLRQNAKE